MAPKPSKRPRRRSNNPAGRPPDADVTDALQRAVIGLLAQSSYEKLSIEAIARHAGVSRPALYRRFSSVGEMALSALEAAGKQAARMAETDDLKNDLNIYLTRVARALDSNNPIGRAFRCALREALVNPQFRAEFTAFITRRREPVATRLRLSYPSVTEVQLERMVDGLFGPILYRLMVRGVCVEDEAIRDIVATALIQR
jgi:AcrR family transcriptional regulator